MLLGVAPGAYAQSSAEVSGIVTDATGAIVPSAAVTIRETSTNATRQVNANGDGLYEFTNLVPGHYKITSTVAGFAAYSADLDVTVGAAITLNVKLSAGSTNTVVEVTSNEAVQVNTETPEVSQVITSEQVSELPSLTRNPYDFVALSGNISSGDNTASGAAQNGANRGVNFSLNGQRNTGTEILLDGVENIQIFGDGLGVVVPIDDVQEYRVITNNYPAQYGRASGGVVSVATASGTNTFHGRVWEFNRISDLASNTVTNAQEGIAKGVFTRNQFGGAVGGPIVKDKLFFFATTELTRIRSASPTVAVVPSAELLAASAANVQSFFSTYAGATNYSLLSQSTNAQVGAALKQASGIEYSGLSAATPVYNVVQYNAPGDAGGGIPQNTYNITGRVDYNIGQNTQMFFRYVNYNEADQSGSAFSSPYPQYNIAFTNQSTAYLYSLAHEFSSSLSTLSKLSFSRFNQFNSYDTSLQNTPVLIVAPNAKDPVSGKSFQFPGFYDTNPANGGLPYGGPQNTIQWNQDIALTKGHHQFMFGGQLLYIQENSAYGAYAQANEQLGSNLKAGLAAIPTGNLFEFEAAVNPEGKYPCIKNQYTGTYTQTDACSISLPATQPPFARSDRFHDWAVYAQDQLKVSSRFTFDYGVRYEYFGVQHNNNPALDSNFVLGAGTSLPQQIRNGQMYTANTSPVGGLWHPQYGTVSPRLGFAYDLFGNGHSSIRGGYGISYERNFGNVTYNVIQNPPNYAVIVINGTPVTNSDTGPLAGSTGSVILPNTSARWVDQNIRTAQTQFFSLSFDQQVGRASVVSVTYNGARGLHLYDIKNYNGLGSGNSQLGDPISDAAGNINLTRLNYQFSNMNQRGSAGDSYYHALNVQFSTQDIRHSGLSLVANYTFSHATDDLSTTFSETSAGDFALGYTDPFNPSLDHGNSDFDIRQRLVLAPIYRTPSFFRSKGGALAQLFGGYELTGIYTVRTGTPFTMYDSTYDASGYNIPRYNPVTPVTHHTFKTIPVGASNTGNQYQLTSSSTQTAGQALPIDAPFANSFYAPYSIANGISNYGISDWGPYPASMTARNSFRGPGAYNLNVSFSKTFPLYERLNLELRAEAYNVTNHHNLYIQQALNDAFNQNATTDSDGNLLATPIYGSPQIFGSKGGVTGGPNDERRFLQFAGKIHF